MPFMLENVTTYICHSSCFGLLISGKPAPVIVYHQSSNVQQDSQRSNRVPSNRIPSNPQPKLEF